MFESEDEIRELQALMDRTLARANPHLLNIVKPERRLNARQVVRYLQGTKHVAFASVNARGEPRVAPLDGVFIRGRFTVSTGRRAPAPPAHQRGMQRRAHGRRHGRHRRPRSGDIIGRGDEGVEEIEPVWREIYESSPFEWGEGVVFMRIEPSSMWAYAFHSENFPE